MIFTSLPMAFLFCVIVDLIMLFAYHFTGLWAHKRAQRNLIFNVQYWRIEDQ